MADVGQTKRRRGRSRAAVPEAKPAAVDPKLEARRAIAKANRAGLSASREGATTFRTTHATVSLVMRGTRPGGDCTMAFEHCVALRDGRPTGHVAQHVRILGAGPGDRIPWSDNAPWLAAADDATFRGRMALADLFSDSPGTQERGIELVGTVFACLADEASRQVEALSERRVAIAAAIASCDGTPRTSRPDVGFTVVSDLNHPAPDREWVPDFLR